MVLDFVEKTETDIAHWILRQGGEPVYFRDLIEDVIEKKQKPVQSLSRAIAEVYTLINMDSRFHHMGHGMWGLMEWVPQETKRSSASTKAAAKRREKLAEEAAEEEMHA